MAHLPKILVAGYGPWVKAERNPAAQVVEDLKTRDWPDCELVLEVMPVRSVGLAEKIEDLLEQHKPDAWVGLGVSDAGIIQPEMVGINWRHFTVPDVTGAQIEQTPVIEAGPAAYNATLPNRQMVDAVNAVGIPASVSYHAGTHLCNQMLYTTAHIIAERGLQTLNGFVHVPQTPANIALTERQKPHASSMSLPMISEAIAICVNTLAQEITTQQAVTA